MALQARTSKAIVQAIAGSACAAARSSFRVAAVEAFELEPGEEPDDLASALRVGALDGRHPEIEQAAPRRIARALRNDGRLFLHGGDPLREVPLGAD